MARAFAAADVEGDVDRLLDPLTLHDIGFDLVRRGEAVWLLGAGRGGLTLTRASTGTAVYGGPTPESWRYTVTAPGPSETSTTFAPAGRVHVRQNAAPEAPWRGRSGLTVAAASGVLATSLAGSLLGQSQATADNLREAIQSGLRLALPETTAAGGGQGRVAAPLTDWKPYRLGPTGRTPRSDCTRWCCRRRRACAGCRRRWCRGRTRPARRRAKASGNTWR